MLEYLEHEGIISAHTFGVMTQPDFVKLAEDTFAHGAKYGVDRYLADHMDMTPDINTIDLFDLSKIHQQMRLQGKVKVAAMYSALSEKKMISPFIKCEPGARAFTIFAISPLCGKP